MLTRSKARALMKESTMEMVSPSATGKGTHTRWRYPEGHILASAKPAVSSDLFSGSLSSFSSSSSSSSSSLSSDASFHVPAAEATVPVTPQRANRPPVTPPRLAPKKLQRSPGNCRWSEQNGYTRVVLVENPFTPEAVSMRESMIQIQLDKIADREMEALMKQRDIMRQAQEADDSDEGYLGVEDDFDMECDCEEGSHEGSEDLQFDGGSTGESSMEEESQDGSAEMTFGMSYTRGDTVEVEDIVPPMVGPSRRLRRLGPTGTELIDPASYTPSGSNTGLNAVYPEAWKTALRGQPTEVFIR